jgi:hypothetical protein
LSLRLLAVPLFLTRSGHFLRGELHHDERKAAFILTDRRTWVTETFRVLFAWLPFVVLGISTFLIASCLTVVTERFLDLGTWLATVVFAVPFLTPALVLWAATNESGKLESGSGADRHLMKKARRLEPGWEARGLASDGSIRGRGRALLSSALAGLPPGEVVYALAGNQKLVSMYLDLGFERLDGAEAALRWPKQHGCLHP